MGFRSDIVQTSAKSVLNMKVTKCNMSKYIRKGLKAFTSLFDNLRLQFDETLTKSTNTNNENF